jgi:dTDP-4-dehydrorhamnose 3,5-epimerase
VLEIERIEDDRGFFARSWCADEFLRSGLNPRIAQCNISFNARRGTLRGLHLQAKPYEEAKLVRCTSGAIFDVIVDLRPRSTSYKRWFSIELDADNRRMVYVPEGVAHGFQTLVENTEVFYQMSEFYHPECAEGIPWDDPQLGITWPISDPIMSTQDKAYQRRAY